MGPPWLPALFVEYVNHRILERGADPAGYLGQWRRRVATAACCAKLRGCEDKGLICFDRCAVVFKS
mgnify:CR=1 FL=1|jgi:hypothetical protein